MLISLSKYCIPATCKAVTSWDAIVFADYPRSISITVAVVCEASRTNSIWALAVGIVISDSVAVANLVAVAVNKASLIAGVINAVAVHDASLIAGGINAVAVHDASLIAGCINAVAVHDASLIAGCINAIAVHKASLIAGGINAVAVHKASLIAVHKIVWCIGGIILGFVNIFTPKLILFSEQKIFHRYIKYTKEWEIERKTEKER